MSNKVKDISIRNHIYYFSKDIMNIRIFDPNNIKIDKKFMQKYILYTTLDMSRSKIRNT